MTNEIKATIVEIVEDNGIEIDENGNLDNINSLKFISMLVSIEETFNIEIPDDYLLLENSQNIESILVVIENELSRTHA